MEIYDVVKKLLGDIEPVGETREDERRHKNLVETCDLVDKLLTDIDRVIPNKNRTEHSMKKAGEYADSFFDGLGITE